MALNIKEYNDCLIISNDEAAYLIKSAIYNNLKMYSDTNSVYISTNLGDIRFHRLSLQALLSAYDLSSEPLLPTEYGSFIPVLLTGGVTNNYKIYGWINIGEFIMNSNRASKNLKSFIVDNLNLFS